MHCQEHCINTLGVPVSNLRPTEMRSAQNRCRCGLVQRAKGSITCAIIVYDGQEEILKITCSCLYNGPHNFESSPL